MLTKDIISGGNNMKDLFKGGKHFPLVVAQIKKHAQSREDAAFIYGGMKPCELVDTFPYTKK